MTSAITLLVSLRNRLRQALPCCSGFFDPVFSKTPGTQTVKVHPLSHQMIWYRKLSL